MHQVFRILVQILPTYVCNKITADPTTEILGTLYELKNGSLQIFFFNPTYIVVQIQSIRVGRYL